MNNAAKIAHRPDYLVISCIIFLVLFGLVMLGSASANLGETKFGDTYYYLKHQLWYGLLPGIIGLLIASKIYYGKYEKWALPILIATIALLSLAFTGVGQRLGGALRWISLAGITFQPAELAKLGVIIYFAAWLSGNKERQHSFMRGFLPFIVILGTIGAILLRQSSTGLFAIIFIIACIMYFGSGAKIIRLISIGVIGIIVVLIISYLTPYRWNRIMTYLNPNANQETTGYHINQALTAIGSGGLTGVGLGKSTTKIKFLPEPIGDSIFAVIAEELGFIGGILLIGVIIVLTLRILIISTTINNTFGQLLLLGFGSLIGIQSFINIGAISGIIPLTGTPLPFVSYGGTALATFMTISGIVINISTYTHKSL